MQNSSPTTCLQRQGGHCFCAASCARGEVAAHQQQRKIRHQRKQQYPHPYRHQFGFMKYLIRIYLLSQSIIFFRKMLRIFGCDASFFQ